MLRVRRRTAAVALRRAASFAAFVLALALAAAGGLPAPAQEGKPPPVHPERAAESEFQTRSRDPRLDAAGWVRLGAWCEAVADELPATSRSVFHKRAAECRTHALRKLREEIDALAARSREQLSAAAGYVEARRVRDRFEFDGRDQLANVLTGLPDDPAKTAVQSAFNSRLEEIDAILKPIRDRSIRKWVEEGRVPVDGVWAPMRESRGNYAGWLPFSKLAAGAGEFLDRRVTTEIASGLAIFDLLESSYLDGFDENGKYLVPNFAEERLMLALGAEARAWVQEFHSRRPAGPGESGPRFQVRLVVEIARRERQFTPFYEANVLYLAVRDAKGQVIDAFVSEEDPRDAQRR
jgi:hypothetical protein